MYSINFWYYQTQTFGCPLTKQIIIKSVYYGNDYMGCFLPQNESVSTVQKACSGPVCANIRASDDFFQKKDFCIRSSKKMNVTYSCVEGNLEINLYNSHFIFCHFLFLLLFNSFFKR